MSKITPGMVLARPVPLPHDPYRFLLQRDREIPTAAVARLKQLGVLEVWVRHRNLEFLEDIIDEGVGDQQRHVYAHVRRNFETIMQDSAAELDLTHFEASIGDLFNVLKHSSCGSILLHKLDAFDNYLMSHSTNVCYLALLLGMKLESYLIEERSAKAARDAKDLKQLGLGCILHDVGKMLIPPEILNKPEKLTDEEMDVMKMHPVYGYEMVKGRVPSAAAQIVLNHHLQYAGGGYPDRIDTRTGEVLPPLTGKQIPIFCRIATACDVYDAATTRRVYSNAKPPVQALYEMRTQCRGYFDPIVEQAFYEVIPPFPIGQIVMLSNDMEAAIVDFNPRFPTRPKVQGIKMPSGELIRDPSMEEMDLAIYTDIEIVSVNGVDVRPFVSGQPLEAELAAI